MYQLLLRPKRSLSHSFWKHHSLVECADQQIILIICRHSGNISSTSKQLQTPPKYNLKFLSCPRRRVKISHKIHNSGNFRSYCRIVMIKKTVISGYKKKPLVNYNSKISVAQMHRHMHLIGYLKLLEKCKTWQLVDYKLVASNISSITFSFFF